jgi:SSS family solute:Na+ symporter/sodium/proline symporter
LGINIYRTRKVKSHEDFMVAGRMLPIRVMVFTLIATWIGSGTFIAGAEYAYKAGFSSLWLPAGAWVGILVIYFLSAKVRTFGQYTVGDILETRYGRFARLFGSIAILIAYTTIVSYQFRAGGLILNIVTDGQISVAWGQAISAFFIIAFTVLAGMLSVAYTDLPNGILILVACLIATPFVIISSGGLSQAVTILPEGHFRIFSEEIGALKAFAYFFSTLMLLMGEQSMYQKFYSAKSPGEAKKAVGLWIVGTIVVEVVVVVIAVFASVQFWDKGKDPASMVLVAARYMVPPAVGVLLLAAAWAVLLSTGTNFLLSASTNVMRDMVQKTFHRQLSEKRQIVGQKIVVIILGLYAFSLIFIPTILNKKISVLEQAYFAYTMYGVAITPALIAALAWKRTTFAGGLASVVSGATAVILLKYIVPVLWPSVMIEGYPEIMANANHTITILLRAGSDPWGIPIIFPALILSVGALILVSLLTPKPDEKVIQTFFPRKS